MKTTLKRRPWHIAA